MKTCFRVNKLKSLFFPLVGLAATIWFLVRVIPKPSRATYPCQQAAFPVASAFVVWLTGIFSSSLLFSRAKRKWRNARYLLALTMILAAAVIFMTSASVRTIPAIANILYDTGDDMPVMTDRTAGSGLVVLPEAYVGVVKSLKPLATDIDSIEVDNMVRLAVERAGGLADIVHDGDTVIIKPNIVSAIDGTASGQQLSPLVNGVSTDYRVVQAVVSMVRELNPSGKIFILEGSANSTTYSNMVRLRYNRITGADSLVCLEDVCGNWGDTTSVNLTGVSLPPGKALYNGANNRYWMLRLVHDADVLISVPVLKNHYYAGASGGAKNVGIGATPPTIYGNTNDLMRLKIDHTSVAQANLHNWIHDYYLCRPVDFTVMDGLQGLQNGPVSVPSTPHLSDDQMNMRMILASKDPIANDAIEALLCGHDPALIRHLVTLNNDTMGCCDPRLIRVNGILVGSEKKNFETEDVGVASKYYDFTGPEFSVDKCISTGDQLHLYLTVDEQVTRVEVKVDGVFLDQIALGDFGEFFIDLDSTEIGPGSEIIVYAYDRYLNHTSRLATLMGADPENENKPGKTGLIKASPNPFTDRVWITFETSVKDLISLVIYDLSGKTVKTLFSGERPAGLQRFCWDGTDDSGARVGNGTYVCSLTVNNRQAGAITMLSIH
jgi:uncharacterized protein (DUF362 family)